MAYLYPFKGECMEPAELGNKGANIVAMTRLGLPVPPGFIVSIKAYQRWRDHGGFPDGEIIRALALLEFETDKRLGQGMAVSVRSSAPVSMPGMLDTVLN